MMHTVWIPENQSFPPHPKIKMHTCMHSVTFYCSYGPSGIRCVYMYVCINSNGNFLSESANNEHLRSPTWYTSSISLRVVSIHVVCSDSATCADRKARTYYYSLCTTWPTAVTFLRSIVWGYRDSYWQRMIVICCGSWLLLENKY